MLFSETSFIGIDPSAGVKPFIYAAIDQDRDLIALGQGQIDGVLAFAAGQRQAIVAVCAPRRPNSGIMADEKFRETLSPQPQPGRWIDFRMADYQIWQHNIRSPQTRHQESSCPNWMQMGFSLYRRLENFGYQTYPREDAQCQVMEVYPQACFAVLLGLLPFAKNTIEGRLQRQLVLYINDLNIPDPMRFLKDITSKRLLNGLLPHGNLYQPEELDALVAAYTAWLSKYHPDQITLYGDSTEGQVVIPAAELQEKYT
jgi:hypothetical protein